MPSLRNCSPKFTPIRRVASLRVKSGAGAAVDVVEAADVGGAAGEGAVAVSAFDDEAAKRTTKTASDAVDVFKLYSPSMRTLCQMTAFYR